MTLPKIDNRFTIGNIIQIGMFIVALALGWASIQGKVEAANERLEDLRAASAAVEIRVRMLESRDARNEERLSNILTFLERIDGRLERIERAEGTRP